MPRSLKPATFNNYHSLLTRVKQTLIDGQQRIEAERIKTYWETGRIIDTHILKHQDRAEYGAEVLRRLSKDLNIDVTTLQRCIQFAKTYPKLPIYAARHKFSWSHYRELIAIADDKKRLSLEKAVSQNAWSSRELAARIKEDRADHSETLTPKPKTPLAKLLTPIRGQLYTYKIVTRPQVALEKESGLLLDLGFGDFRNVAPKLLSNFSEGDIVTSQKRVILSERKRNEGSEFPYKIIKGTRTPKDLFTYAAYIERVVDGDTVKVRFDLGFDQWHRDTLRLRGLDCPEMDTKEGQAAKAFVQSYLKESQFVVVHSSRSDKYDRYLADIFIPQEDSTNSKNPMNPTNSNDIYLNNLLLENGHAVRVG